MSITFLKELSGRSGTIGDESVRTFIFKSDNANDSEFDVYRNRFCPKIGSQHPDFRFSLFFLKQGDLEIEQGEGIEWFKWTVTAKYTQLEPGEEKPEEQANNVEDIEQPDFQPHVTVDFEEFSKPLEFSIKRDGQYDESSPAGFGAVGVVSSALEPPETPPEVFRLNTIIRVTRNLGLRSRLWRDAQELKNTINTDSFTYRRGTFVEKVKPKQSRIKIRVGDIVDYRTKTGKKSQYAELEVQFIIDKETWNIDLLDYGTVKLSTAGKTIAQRHTENDWGLAGGTTQQPIKDEDDNRIQGLLDGTGQVLGAGDPSVFNRWYGYFEKKHAGFFKAITRRV